MAEVMATPGQVIKVMEACYKAKLPVLLEGAPGVGKTSLSTQLAKRLSVNGAIIDHKWRITSIMDPVDFNGLPDIKSGETAWLTPAFYPRSGEGIWNWDEVNRCSPMVANVVMQSLLLGSIGDYQWPEGWWQMATMNPPGTRGVIPLPGGFYERCCHVRVKVSWEDWATWADGNDIVDPVKLFLRNRPDLLETVAGCGRSWEFISRIIRGNGLSMDRDTELIAFAGVIGDGAALEFCAFLDAWRRGRAINLDAIITSPTTAPLPDGVGTMFAVTAGLAKRANPSNWPSIVAYLKRLSPEFGAFGVARAVKLLPILQSTREYRDWEISH